MFCTEHVYLTSVGGAKTKSGGWRSSSGGGSCAKTRSCKSYKERVDTQQALS